jgi:probable F420-dependent oxidoreductase
MRVYLMVRPRLLKDFPEQAGRAEAFGFDGITMLELTVPPTLSAVASAMNTSRIDLLTGIFVAFPRSPMATAYDAWSVQSLSNGRFQLGLGAQTKSHLTRRWSVESVPPVPRMREYVESMRAIWDCWQNGTRLAYDGKHYQFSMMIPYYDPGPIDHPHVPVYLAAINKFMCRLTGEIADGHIPGDPVTYKWFCEMMLPNLEIGAKRAGRTLKDLDLGGHGFIGCAKTEAGLEAVRKRLRERVALYASTPEYRPMLEMHGWQDKFSVFIELAREGKWQEMGDHVTDEMLDEYTVVGTPEEVPGKLAARFGGVTQRVQLDDEWFEYMSDADIGALVAAIRQIQ